MSKKGDFGKFLLGGLIGVGIGALLSPKTGKENRAALVQQLNNLKAKVSEIDAKEVKKNFEDKIYEIQDALEDLDKEKVYDIAQKQAKNVKKKTDELYALAKEKGTPYVKDASEKVREKAIEVTKDVLARLEKKEK
ncbi:MAG: YtxH domain-containing protein [Bacilli bacterium]|nr:YtxH domain-containing protein [Bacilli bacterium]